MINDETVEFSPVDTDVRAEFDAQATGLTFAHDIVRERAFEDFAAAMREGGNADAAEIFDAVTRDRNYFARAVEPIDMGGLARIDPAELERERFGRLSLFERFKYAKENPGKVEKLL